MKHHGFLHAAILLACAAPCFAQDMKPGLWEIATTTRMQGMDLPGGRFAHCFTASDIAAGKQYNPDDTSKCSISNLKSAGGKISYDIDCAVEGGRMAGSAKGSMSPASYSWELKIRMTPDQGMGEIFSTVQGRRTGDCK